MRFHVLGVSFAPTNKDYSCEGFSQKVRLFCKLVSGLGHTVYHYGVEGSNPICTENINVVSLETYNKTHKAYNYEEKGFLYYSETEAQEEFNFNTILEINKRKQEHDFLCFSFGFPQRPIYDAHPELTAIEIGVGFDGSFAPNRVFESYAWMHTIYGKENNLQHPNFYDAVIPNYYDLDDYIFSEEKDDYFFFIARMDPSKGIEIALKCAERAGKKLICAGVGKPHIESPNLIHVGVVDFEQRAKLMSRAKATFVTTNYIEPFGSTVIESMLCGTPVISTDFGAFTETVIHGKTGYRCRTMEQFYWATKNIDNIKPIDCRNYAVNNFSMKRISKMYQEFFNSLYRLSTKDDGWNSIDISRKDLDWLNKYFPESNSTKDTKPILSFFVGYMKIEEKSELLKIAEKFSENYRVIIFGTNINYSFKNNIEYVNSNDYKNFIRNNTIDILILRNYIYYFLEFDIKNEDVFLWLDNSNCISPYYENVEFNNLGRGFLKNILDKIDRIIISKDNIDVFKNYYNITNDEIFYTDNIYELIKNNNN